MFGKVAAFIKGHKILVGIIAIILAAVIVVPSVCVSLLTIPKVDKADRVSEGIKPTPEDLATAEKYDRVVIFGVDGAGGTFDRFDTPNFDRIFGEGNVNQNGTAQYPTMSGPNWASMMLGVTAQKHQITNNKATSFKNKGEYATFFKTYSDSHPEATFFSAVNWKPINHGIIEDGIPGMTKVNATSIVKKGEAEEVDKKVAELVVERLNSFDDTIVFMHFDSVDHAGHAHGNASKEYREAMETVDEYLGMVYDAYKAKGLLDSTLFICVSDHGHTVKGGHGKESASEKQTTLALSGKTVKKGTSKKYVTHDLASIVLYALGVAQPDYYDGGVPQDLFNTL